MVFTNGDMLTDETVSKLADAGLYSMYVSADSPVADEHDKLRRSENLFSRAIDSAHSALDAGILVGLATYATSERLAEGKVEQVIELARREGFNEVTVFDCIPSGNYLKRRDILLTPDAKRRIVELAVRYHHDGHPMGVIARAVVNSPLGVGCYGAASELCMTPCGDIDPCDFNPVSLGNVLDEPLAEIWTRMATHPDFRCRHKTCRMQTPSYLAKFIDILPDGARLPVRIEDMERIWRERGISRKHAAE